MARRLHKDLLDPPAIDRIEPVRIATAMLVATVVTILRDRVSATHLSRIDLALERLMQCQTAMSAQMARNSNAQIDDEGDQARPPPGALDASNDGGAMLLVAQVEAEQAAEDRDAEMLEAGRVENMEDGKLEPERARALALGNSETDNEGAPRAFTLIGDFPWASFRSTSLMHLTVPTTLAKSSLRP
ncbi:hypothetical protein GGF32_006564 [Allomyces javanicus]|nr:hypothetical protein GGF32_006564 [Allomyces javanicus]